MKKGLYLICIFLVTPLIHLLADENLQQYQIHLSVQSWWREEKDNYERSKSQRNKMNLRMAEYYGLLLNKRFSKTYEYCDAYFKDEYNFSQYNEMMEKQVSRYYEDNLQPTDFLCTRIVPIETEDFEGACLITCVILSRNFSNNNSNNNAIKISSIQDFWVLSKDTWRVIPGNFYPHRPGLELKLLKLPFPIKKNKEN